PRTSTLFPYTTLFRSGIGKVQWNHILNDHSFFSLRVAENFNQYIFDQPIVDANLPQENTPDFRVSANCPLEPYLPGTPVAAAGPDRKSTRLNSSHSQI